jgi:hypothetical protein
VLCMSRARRIRVVVAVAALSALLAAPSAAAEIFKCVAKDGSPLYQNFPCDIDSLGLPSNTRDAKTASMSTAASQAMPMAASVNVASAIKSANVGEVRIGMSSDEVRALLGEPEEMVADEPAEGGPISIWRYAGGRSVQFDQTHHVSEVHR